MADDTHETLFARHPDAVRGRLEAIQAAVERPDGGVTLTRRNFEARRRRA